MGGRRRGSGPMAPDPRPPNRPPRTHSALSGRLWTVTERGLGVQALLLSLVKPLGPSAAPSPHPCTQTPELGPPKWARDPRILPTPRACHPVTAHRSPARGEGRGGVGRGGAGRARGGPTHLGKLGDAPGPVRGRAAVGGSPAPRPGLLHGPQGARLQGPQERRLQRAGEEGWCPGGRASERPSEAAKLFHPTNAA